MAVFEIKGEKSFWRVAIKKLFKTVVFNRSIPHNFSRKILLLSQFISIFTDLLTNGCCWIPGGGAETGGADADCDGGPLGVPCVDPALCGASKGVVLCACCVCSPPE